MSVEIERKFILDSIPVHLGDGEEIRQGYVAVDGEVTTRVRIRRGEAWLTVKAGRGVRRTEVELPLDAEHAQALWPFTEGRRVEKTRHQVELAELGLVAEVDRFHGALDGLVLVEVEFADIDGARAFAPPAWFGREVTDEPGWTNAALACDGRPDRSPKVRETFR